MPETRPVHLLWSLLPLLIGWGASAAGSFTVAWLCYALAFALAAAVIVVSVTDAATLLIRARKDFIQAFSEADPEARDALGLKYPKLRVSMSGEPRVEVADSGVTLRYFRVFLTDSDPIFIAAMGKYGDKTIARQQYLLWRRWLLDEGMIYPDRSRQNETFLWRSDAAYWRLVNNYVNMRIPTEFIPEGDAPPGTQAIPGSVDLIGMVR
jgi:hypothetical protein